MFFVLIYGRFSINLRNQGSWLNFSMVNTYNRKLSFEIFLVLIWIELVWLVQRKRGRLTNYYHKIVIRDRVKAIERLYAKWFLCNDKNYYNPRIRFMHFFLLKENLNFVLYTLTKVQFKPDGFKAKLAFIITFWLLFLSIN